MKDTWGQKMEIIFCEWKMKFFMFMETTMDVPPNL